MIQFFISTLVSIAQKKRSKKYYTVNFIAISAFVLLGVPYFYFYTGRHLPSIIQLSELTILLTIIAMIILLIGGILIAWTLAMHYSYGKGSASHTAPIQQLIVSGPYAISRHPMLLGAVFFYFGIGTITSSIEVGLYGAMTTAILSYLLIRYIEEPVLIVRFGQAYKSYQKTVPIVPSLFNCFNYSNRKHKASN